MKRLILYASFLPTVLVSCSMGNRIKKSARVNILQNDNFKSAHTGICFYEPARGRFWYNYQGDKYFVPASNTKLFTCFAAMKYLGDSIVGLKYLETEDTLFIAPYGDPTFLGAEFINQPVYDFLKNNSKPIVLNTSLWNDERWGNGWSWNDYNDDYAAERSVMPVYENLATFGNGANGIMVTPSCFVNDIVSNYEESNNFSSIKRDISSNTFFIKGNDSLRNAVEVPFYTGSDSILVNLLKDTLHKAIYTDHSLNNKVINNWQDFHSQSTDSLLKITMHQK